MKINTPTSQTNRLLIALVLLGVLLLAGCAPRARVGALQTESQSVELGNEESVRIEIDFGAGDLQVTGGAEKLLEANFTYNVAKLKPEVEYTHDTLVLSQPESKGLPDLQDITGFRNEWGLRLNDDVPMDLSVNMGAGTSDLQLADLSLTGLDINLGASESTVDLSGDWARDLHVSIDVGAADVSMLLPRDVGVRVEVDRGPTPIDAPELVRNGSVYTNEAYGASKVTLRIDITTGIGWLNLEVEE